MRKIKCVLFLLALSSCLIAQQSEIDSLRQLLIFAKEDTNKVNLLNKLAFNFIESKPDSNLFYANPALELSRKIGYKKGEIRALFNLSGGFTLKGNYSKGLESGLAALKKSEIIHDDHLIANCLFAVGIIYSLQEDHRTAIAYWLNANSIYQKFHDSLGIGNVLTNTGAAYNELNQLDSARIYFNECLEIGLRLKNEDLISPAYTNLGLVNLKMKQYEVGMSYCRLGLPHFKRTNNHLFLSSTYYIMCDLFDSTGHRDSAFYYSQLSYHHATEMDAPLLLLYSAKQLSALYKESERFDSAFVYHEIAMNVKDSLTNQERRKQVEALTFNEQLRQQEIQKQKLEAAATRKRNLELAGIAVFIPIFLSIVMLLGRRKVKTRTVEFLGVLALLFLFEFIVLFAHPYIGHWTHESPIWMLLILVTIAAILVPLHHRSESWMKKKLANKVEMQLQPEKL